MSAKVKNCTACGGPMGEGQQVRFVATPGMQAGPAAQPAAAAKKGPPILAIGCIGAIVAVIALVVVSMMWTKEASVKVTGHTWERTVVIETFGEVKEKGPCKDMPKKAKLLKKHQAKPECKTKKVDQGDGTFKEKKECSEPVAQCDYNVTKWAEARTLKEAGTGLDSKPRWPVVPALKTGNCLGCEREGARDEKYIVQFDDNDGGTQKCSFNAEGPWKSYKVGSAFKGEKSVVTGSLDCGSLAAQ